MFQIRCRKIFWKKICSVHTFFIFQVDLFLFSLSITQLLILIYFCFFLFSLISTILRPMSYNIRITHYNYTSNSRSFFCVSVHHNKFRHEKRENPGVRFEIKIHKIYFKQLPKNKFFWIPFFVCYSYHKNRMCYY